MGVCMVFGPFANFSICRPLFVHVNSLFRVSIILFLTYFCTRRVIIAAKGFSDEEPSLC